MSFRSNLPNIKNSSRPFIRPRHYLRSSDSDSESDHVPAYRLPPLSISCRPAALALRIPSCIPPLPPYRRLHDPNLHCERKLDWNIDYATAFIADHLVKNSRRAVEALRKVRCEGRRTIAVHGQSMPEIAYRNFNILDAALFDSELRDAVYLDFKNLDSDVSGRTYNPGEGPNPRVSRISIVFNTAIHRTSTADEVIATLVHHMIHAFFLIACGPQGIEEIEYGKLEHGMHFGKLMHTIKKLSASGGRALPLGFGHRLQRERNQRRYYDSGRSSFSKRHYCSHCPAYVEAIQQADVDAWYRTTCEPLLSLPEFLHKSNLFVYKDDQLQEMPRSEATPSTESVEFIFEDKGIQIATEKIDAYPSVKAAFKQSRWLEIPKSTTLETLTAMLEFLSTGNYSPDIASVQVYDGRGPPLIKSISPGLPPLLKADIRAFRLACALKFEEIKAFVLNRLSEQHITHEDPISILIEIYSSAQEPDPDLRGWVRSFLIRAPTRSLDMAITSRTPSYREPSNLGQLERNLTFKDRFLDIVHSNEALHADVIKARTVLLSDPRRTFVPPVHGLQPHPSMSKDPWVNSFERRVTVDDIDLHPRSFSPGYDPPRYGAMSADPYRSRCLRDTLPPPCTCPDHSAEFHHGDCWRSMGDMMGDMHLY